MNDIVTEKKDELEIDLQQILNAVIQKAWLVILAAVLCAILTLMGTIFMITPQYKATAMFYVNNNAISVGDVSLSSITSSDISASKNLVKSYIVILNTRTTLNDVIDYAGVDRSYAEVKRMISASSVDETEIFEVVVTSPDPKEAEQIANAISYILPKRIDTIIEGTSAKIVDSAVVPSKPSSPSYTRNTLLGFMCGFMMTLAAIVLLEVFDVTVRTEEDIAQSCHHPILAAVPDLAASGKGGYEYAYDRKNPGSKTGTTGKQVAQPALFGGDISFAASESYKLLRTKIQFSFADENNSRVIGVSSALSGEGKSLTAVNLAYTISQLGKKVILIDCDMRRPTLAEKLKIQKKPGLSSLLSGQAEIETLIQYCGIKKDEQAFHVIAAGQNPPNPVELLSSARMSRMIQSLRKVYDYVILDLPPIGEVSDALAVVKETDGILMVVRQNYCNRIALGDATRQFEFVDAKMLGVVFNCTNEHSGKYGKGYYKKYYKKYYGRTGEGRYSPYEIAGRKTEAPHKKRNK